MGNNIILDEAKYVLYDLSSIKIREVDTLLKGYMRGDFLPHCHFSLKVRECPDSEPQYFCAVYQRATDRLFHIRDDKCSIVNQFDTTNGTLCEVKSAMLIDVAEFMENPKGVDG